MTITIPMFPLGSVLLPYAPLPLHIFEPRYRSLIRTCLDQPSEFGVTLIAKGHEVGGGDLRTMVGVFASLEEAYEAEDGRWAVLAQGTERFRVLQWLDDDPYPIAEVEPWPDESSPLPAADRFVTVERLRTEVAVMAQSLGYQAVAATLDHDAQHAGAAYRIAAVSPLGETDRYDLLCAPDAISRLDLLERRLLDQRILFGSELAMGSQPRDW
jgi:hypothetical protein